MQIKAKITIKTKFKILKISNVVFLQAAKLCELKRYRQKCKMRRSLLSGLDGRGL